MQRQTRDYVVARQAAGLLLRFQEFLGANHYTILNDMVAPDGQIHRAIMNLLR